MSYDNLSSVSQNVLKFYQQLTSEERRVPFIFGRNNLMFWLWKWVGQMWGAGGISYSTERDIP
jgi:hypothetical protein